MKSKSEISKQLENSLYLANYAKQKIEKAKNPLTQEMWTLRYSTLIDQIMVLRWVLEDETPWVNEIWQHKL